MTDQLENVDELDAFLNGQEWASIQRLCELLNVKQSTMRSWILRGNAPVHYKLGALTRFKPADVRVWLDDNRGRLTDRQQEIADALSAADDERRARRDELMGEQLTIDDELERQENDHA